MEFASRLVRSAHHACPSAGARSRPPRSGTATAWRSLRCNLQPPARTRQWRHPRSPPPHCAPAGRSARRRRAGARCLARHQRRHARDAAPGRGAIQRHRAARGCAGVRGRRQDRDSGDCETRCLSGHLRRRVFPRRLSDERTALRRACRPHRATARCRRRRCPHHGRRQRRSSRWAGDRAHGSRTRCGAGNARIDADHVELRRLDCVMAVIGIALCKCFSSGGNQTTSPCRIFSNKRVLAQKLPVCSRNIHSRVY